MNSIGNHLRNYIKTGDRKWFAMIYEETMPQIYRYYYFKTMERELSEDLTSEVFIRVYSNLRNTNLNGKSFIPWIYRISHNLLVDHFRKNKGEEVPLEQGLENIKLYDDNILKKESAYLRKELGFEMPELILALNGLTVLQKDVIILRFVEDMDYGTIARIFNKNKGTIRGIVFRAMEKIRKEMTGSDK